MIPVLQTNSDKNKVWARNTDFPRSHILFCSHILMFSPCFQMSLNMYIDFLSKKENIHVSYEVFIFPKIQKSKEKK